MKIRAPTRAIPPITPMTIPAMEPPLRLELWPVDLAAEVSSPEVELAPETVIVLTWPPALVVSLTTLPVVLGSVLVVCRQTLVSENL